MSGYDPTEHGWQRTGLDQIERAGYRIVRSGISTGPLSDPTHGPVYHAHTPRGGFLAVGGDLKTICETCTRHEQDR